MPFSSPFGKRLPVCLLLVLWSVSPLETQAIACNQTVPASEERALPPLTSSPASNIAAVLRDVAARMQCEGLTAANVTAHQPARYTTPLVRVDGLGRLHTAILVTGLDTQAETALAAQHVQLERVERSARVVQAWVPFDRLETVAALPFVRYLQPPRYAHRR